MDDPRKKSHSEVKILGGITISKDVLTLMTKKIKEITAERYLDLASSFPCSFIEPY